MPNTKATEIILTEKTTEILESFIRKQNCSQCLTKRASMILMSAQGLANKAIAREVKMNVRTVRHWRNKGSNNAEILTQAEINNLSDKDFTKLIIDILKDEQRPGTPPTFSPEQIIQIVAIACENPKDSSREISHWTETAIADEAIKRNIVSTISQRSIGRFLKSGKYKTTS